MSLILRSNMIQIISWIRCILPLRSNRIQITSWIQCRITQRKHFLKIYNLLWLPFLPCEACTGDGQHFEMRTKDESKFGRHESHGQGYLLWLVAFLKDTPKKKKKGKNKNHYWYICNALKYYQREKITKHIRTQDYFPMRIQNLSTISLYKHSEQTTYEGFMMVLNN